MKCSALPSPTLYTHRIRWLSNQLHPAAWQEWWMDGDGRRQERSHLSGTLGESWPLTVVMDGNSALPSVGLAGCLAQPFTPGWGSPCEAALLFLWLGDQLLAPRDGRLAKGAKPRTHRPREGRAAYDPPGESEGKPWPLAVFLFSSQVLCEPREVGITSLPAPLESGTPVLCASEADWVSLSSPARSWRHLQGHWVA